MKKILCPTDFSDASITGISYAAKLAKKIDGSLTLFNVVALTRLLPEEALMGEEVNVTMAKSRLETQSREVAQVFRISCSGDAQPTFSSVSDVIAAKAADYTFVVMGSNGADDIKEFFLGSQTYQAIRKVQKPIIMVPKNTVFAEPEKILYAYDYWRNGHVPMAQLISFSQLIKCHDIMIVQVMEESISLDAEEELRQSQSSLKRFYQDQINLTFETLHASGTIEAIQEFMKDHQRDMLALCSEHRTFVSSLFHTSVIKSITGSAGYPVVVFHN